MFFEEGRLRESCYTDLMMSEIILDPRTSQATITQIALPVHKDPLRSSNVLETFEDGLVYEVINTQVFSLPS